MALRTAVVFVWHGQKKETWREKEQTEKTRNNHKTEFSPREKLEWATHTFVALWQKNKKSCEEEKYFLKKKVVNVLKRTGHVSAVWCDNAMSVGGVQLPVYDPSALLMYHELPIHGIETHLLKVRLIKSQISQKMLTLLSPHISKHLHKNVKILAANGIINIIFTIW